ncbi:MAG: sugar phosphate isomerase/epimerase, partial [Acidobacteria bacterium]|nr:sugar phosphate isomerase/epimerase [Acidobacteriota bacterium]MBI3279527.1 sugar phosphate isomerase/epimerase [Acidobacteriota bacterium]
MPSRFRHATCNEVYQGWDFAEACRSIRRLGYDGIEIAPFTLAEDPPALTPARRREYRRTIEGEGLTFAGLHWLMVAPKGLHVTTPDRELRERSWRHIRNLIDLCADLGPNGVMVFGSPQQRST